MNFKQWFLEYEGKSFPGTPSGPGGAIGAGNHTDVGPESKLNGPGFNYRMPPMMGKKDQAEELYGFRKRIEFKHKHKHKHHKKIKGDGINTL